MKRFLLFVFLSVLSCKIYSNTCITIEDLVNLAMDNNIDIINAKNLHNKAIDSYTTLNGIYIPKIALSTSCLQSTFESGFIVDKIIPTASILQYFPGGSNLTVNTGITLVNQNISDVKYIQQNNSLSVYINQSIIPFVYNQRFCDPNK